MTLPLSSSLDRVHNRSLQMYTSQRDQRTVIDPNMQHSVDSIPSDQERYKTIIYDFNFYAFTV